MKRQKVFCLILGLVQVSILCRTMSHNCEQFLTSGALPPQPTICTTDENWETTSKFYSFSISFIISTLPTITFYLIIAFGIGALRGSFAVFFIYTCYSSQQLNFVYIELMRAVVLSYCLLICSLASLIILLRSILVSVLLLPC